MQNVAAVELLETESILRMTETADAAESAHKHNAKVILCNQIYDVLPEQQTLDCVLTPMEEGGGGREANHGSL